eukprot:Phypoly_transcript_08970.p1 GENE.Phypoly_transcript_08970~~Phypoly_transcript_08970.p1  ORF type:complete len:356 (+),score=5.94 Phypoly_transcript_08970:86-1153(+)
MSGTNNLSDTWTSEQAYKWRALFVPLLCGISLAFCLFAQIVFYIFPRLRKFPRSLLSWLNLYDIYFCVYQLFRWIPAPWHSAMVIYPPGSFLCRFNVYLDVSSLTGQYVCTTLLCVSIFLMVVRRVELEDKPIYFWVFLSSAIFIPILVSIPTILVSTQGVPGGTCLIGNHMVNMLVRSPYIVMLTSQFVLIGWTMKHIRKIYNSVKNNNAASLPIKYIFVRFIATILVQMFNLIPGQYLVTFPNKTYKHAILIRFGIASHAIGPALDAIVLILGNTEFTDWVIREISRFRLYVITRRNERKGKKTQNEIGREFVVFSNTQEVDPGHASYTLQISSDPSTDERTITISTQEEGED